MPLNRSLKEDCDWVDFSGKLVILQAHAIKQHLFSIPVITL